MTLRFQLTTRRTGLRRIVKVAIHDDPASMDVEYRRLSRRAELISDVPDAYVVHGACFPRREWEDRDPRAHQVTILLNLEHVTATVIAHEATHAAMHLYSIDCYRDHARASVHLVGGNEIVPYLVGDIFSAITNRLLQTGHELRAGLGRTYRDV
jgi:hypothetical protein